MTLDLPAREDLDGDGNVIASYPKYSGKVTIPLQGYDNGAGGLYYMGNANAPDSSTGVGVDITIQDCGPDGKWSVFLGVMVSATGGAGTNRMGANVSLCCGEKWSGSIGRPDDLGGMKFETR